MNKSLPKILSAILHQRNDQSCVLALAAVTVPWC